MEFKVRDLFIKSTEPALIFLKFEKAKPINLRMKNKAREQAQICRMYLSKTKIQSESLVF